MFVFFDMADHILFVRDDYESANWSVDQMSLQATFPYKADKEITRGMRVGFQFDGIWQVFEIRKAKVYEPDHYQEITAEHIAISELTDDVYQGDDVTDKTISQVLTPMLSGTLWAIGNDTTSNTSSVDVGISNVWNHVRNIEQNWNAIISPRVTVGSTGITGRYLDIAPNEGTWRGVRLSLEKNVDDLGVVWDDTDVKTALYAYGAENNGTKLTFADEVWTATADHPAKPDGQTYLEDPTAKALYGRNGRNRFGYYQNANIKDAEILLEKTWETLKTLNAPKITINCTVRDLKRLGYADQGIRLHDKVVVEIRPQNKTLVLDVIKLDVDLLDPTSTRPTIGAYIPNIVFIDRENAARASGGHGNPEGESDQIYEFETKIYSNGSAIALEAYQRAYEDGVLSANLLNAWASINLDSTKITSLVTGTGAQLDSNGDLVVDPITGDPVFTTTGGGLYSKISQNAHDITLKVSQGDVATQLSIECGNVTISGGDLYVGGYLEANGITTSAGGTLTADTLEARYGEIDTVSALTVSAGTFSGADHYTMDSYNGDLVDSVKDVQIIAVSGTNNYKLQYKTFSGDTWTDAGTFSKATAPTIGGGWASGVYTVTSDITPAAGSEMSTTLYDLGLGTWTVSGTDMTNTYDIGYASIVGGQQVRGGSTGKTGSITVPVPLQSKSFNSNGTKTPDTGYIGFSSVSFTASYSVSAITNNGTNPPSSDYSRIATVSPLGSLTRYYTFIITAAGVQHKYYIQAQAS